MVGRSSGSPEEVVAVADLRLTMPMRPGSRSLDAVVAAVLGEAPRPSR